MADEQAVIDASATSDEQAEQNAAEAQAAEAAESATAEGEKEGEQDQGATEATEKTGSEPEKPLGEKGKAEVISLRKRAQAAEEARLKLIEENAYLRGKTEALESKGGAAAAPKTEDVRPPRPSIDDFETRQEYDAAMVKYEDNLLDWKIKQVEKTRTTQQSVTQQQTEKAKKLQETLGKVKAEAGDDAYTIVTAPTFPLSQTMLDTVLESESGHKIMGFLAENPEAAARIYSLPLVTQVKEIVKLEQEITTQKPKTTSAPQPASVVKGGAPAIIDDSKLSEEEYYAKSERERQERLKGRV